MKRRDGEHPQAAERGFGWTAGGGQQALWVWQLAALQAGQVAAHPEQVHVEPLQVLLPLLDLKETNTHTKKYSIICRFKVLISNYRAVGSWVRGNQWKRVKAEIEEKKYDP